MVILLVDDDSFFRSAVKTLLQKEGFQVVEAYDGIDGYKIVQEIGDRIDLMLTDIKMPQMDGVELAQFVTQLYPKMPVVLMTAYAFPLDTSGESYVMLKKPIRRHDLVQAIRRLVPGAAGEPGKNVSDSRSPNLSDSSRLEAAERWRTQVREAKERYDESAICFRRVLAEQKEGIRPEPDGSAAVRHARIQEDAARQEYMRLLTILTEIMASEKRPEDCGQ